MPSRQPKRPYKTWVEISRAAFVHNAKMMQRAAGGNKVIAALKANAYGHGYAEAAHSLEAQVDGFAVDALREGQALRAAGVRKPILLMGYTPLAELGTVVREGFHQVVYNRETVATLAKHATRRKPAYVHIKLETGTSRQGVLPEDVGAFAKFLRRFKSIVVEGAYTHFANIEDTSDSSYALTQLERFNAMVANLRDNGASPRMVHSACSAAIMLYEGTHSGTVRSGIALYGLWPSKETNVSMKSRAPWMTLKPVLTWKTMVAQVKHLPEGTPISYGLTEKLTRRSRTAVIPIGYWDGFDRGQSSVGHVLIRGRRAKVLGRVCMNMFVVDVTNIPGVKPEDEVVIIGKQGKEEIPAEEFASRIGTINYEAVTRINPLIPRVIVK